MDVNVSFFQLIQYVLAVGLILFIFKLLLKLGVARRVWQYILFWRWWDLVKDHHFVQQSNSRGDGMRGWFFKYIVVPAGVYWMIPWYFLMYHDKAIPRELAIASIGDMAGARSWFEVIMSMPLPILLYPNLSIQIIILIIWYLGANTILSMWGHLIFKSYDYRGNIEIAIRSNTKWKDFKFTVKKQNPFNYVVSFAASSWIDGSEIHGSRRKMEKAGKVNFGGITENQNGDFVFEVGTQFPARMGDPGRNEDRSALYSAVQMSEAKIINKKIDRRGPRSPLYNPQYGFTYWIGRGFTDHWWNTRMYPHLGIGGKSGAGKSRCLMSILSVVARQDPDTLFVIVDVAKRGRVFGNVIYRPSELFSQERGSIHIGTWKKSLSPMRNVILVDSIEQYCAIIDSLVIEEKWRSQFFLAHPTEDGTDFNAFVEVSPVNPSPLSSPRGLGRVIFVFDEVGATQLRHGGDKKFDRAFEDMQSMIFTNRDVGFSFVMITQRFTVDTIGETRDQFRMIAFNPEKNEVEFMFKIDRYDPVHGIGIYNAKQQSMMPSMTTGAVPRVRLVDMMSEFEGAEKRMSPLVWKNHVRIFEQYYARLNPEIAELATVRQKEWRNTLQLTPDEFALSVKKRKARVA